jgi:hypothetical protein
MEPKVIYSGQSNTPKFQPDSQRWSRKSITVSRSVFSMPLLGSNLASGVVSGPFLLASVVTGGNLRAIFGWRSAVRRHDRIAIRLIVLFIQYSNILLK